MGALGRLLRNLVVALFTGTQNVLKTLWVKLPAPDYVTFDLKGDPPYRPPPWSRRVLGRLSGRPAILDLHTLARRLRRIAATAPVRGVVLRVTDLEAGLPKIETLRELVAHLREAGKEVVFWTAAARTRDAFLLLSGDRLFLAPAGRFDLRGFRLEVTTAREALDKLGVRAHVFRRGTHKSAGEVFTNDGMGPEHRESLEAILDTLWSRLIEAVGEGRGLDEAQARALVDEGPYSGARALEAGLVDGLCYGDELADRLAPAPRARARLVPWAGYRAAVIEPLDWRPVLARRRAIAVVPVRGLIVEGENQSIPGAGRVVGARSVGEALSAARADDAVRAVLLHVDSPGGSALASDLIWREVRRTAAKKPVVAWLDSVAASGGYYVAAAADRIVATPLVLTGSIGVLAAMVEVSALNERLGLTREVLTRGRNAGLGTTARGPEPSEREAMERDLDAVYADFIDRVAKGRGLANAVVAERAEGRVYTGLRALELGLVDELGGFEAALERTRDLARVPPGVEVELRVLEPASAGFPHLGRPLDVVRALLDDLALTWMTEAARRPGTAWAVLPVRIGD